MGATFEVKNGETVITKEKGKPFRILQLTDIHLSGSVFRRRKDRLALTAIRKVVEASDADFIVVTGDMIYPIPLWGTINNLKSSKMFGGLMAELGVPWTFVFGNHDSESFALYTKEQLADYYMALPNCYFQKGEEGLTGCGNYAIKLLNDDGSLNNLLMFIDSNAYLTWNFFSGFDTVHEDQIEWYKRYVTKEAEKNGGKIPPSLAFFHIPPKEFKEGWENCYKSGGEAVYRGGFVNEKDNYFGYPKTVEGKFFGEMVKLGSCRGMFVGHDHLNTLSIDYKGIRLTYGMSIDYLAYKGIEKKRTQRGGTLIDIYDDGLFDINLLPLDSIN